MKRIVIRCDAGPRLGVGHVMRCLALAEEWSARGIEPVLVADLADVAWARGQVEARGFRHLPPPARIGDEVGFVVDLDPAWVVVDSYSLPPEVYDGYRTAGLATLALVDGDPAGKPADVWLDQNIGAEDDLWRVPGDTLRLAGLDFALMRDDILAARPGAPVEEAREVPRVLGFFGGTDAFGAAPVVARELAATARSFEASFVAATDALAAELRAVSLWPGQSLEVLPPLDDLPAAVVSADVVLSASGTSSWELMCLGSAPALLCVADNQRTSYDRAVGAGLAAGLGYLDALAERPGSATEALGELLGSSGWRTSLRERAWHRVDGSGRARVADACEARFGSPDQG